MTDPFVIETMVRTDWPAVEAIYREGIATGHATFEVAPPPSWEDFSARKIVGCNLVARDARRGGVTGWAALSPASTRAVYAGVAEVSLYVLSAYRKQGVGTQLLATLIAASEAQGIWTLQAGIFPENRGSLTLHQRHGFRVIGTRERIGKMTFGPMAGTWRNLMLLERRSNTVGVD